MFGNVSVEFIDIEHTVFKNPSDFTHIKTLPHFSLVQSVSGSYGISINNSEEYLTSCGGMFIAPPQYLQKITHFMDRGEMEARWFFFNIHLNGGYSAELLLDFPVIAPADRVLRLNELLDQLFSSDDYCDRMSISYQIAKVLLSSAKEKNTSYSKPLMEVLDYIKTNFAKKISIADLADLIHISESNLYASFKKQFGSSPISYLNDYRLSMASKYLKNSSSSIEEVSNSVGIDDVRYFSKIFKRKYGMTPSSYRKNLLI